MMNETIKEGEASLDVAEVPEEVQDSDSSISIPMK